MVYKFIGENYEVTKVVSLNSIVGINKQVVYRDLDTGRFLSKVNTGKKIKKAVGDALKKRPVVNAALIDKNFPFNRTIKSAEESAKVFMEHFPPEPITVDKSGKIFKGKGGKVGLALVGAAAIIAGGIALYNKFSNKKNETAKSQQTENKQPNAEKNTANINQNISVEATKQSTKAEENIAAAKYVNSAKTPDNKEDKTPEELLTEAIAILDEVLAGIDNAQN